MPTQTPSGGVSFSMTPYTGAWTKVEASHLLRRTMFGATNQQILDAVTNGMNTTVTNLLQIPAISDPLTYDPGEAITAFGATWINDVYPTGAAAVTTETARRLSLGSWIIERINTEGVSIAERMCLFWQNHFAASVGPDARATYDYHMLIRQYALGNFKQLIKDMTINPNMLLFLNGATNTLYSPNENYARELLELYTIGKGPQIGPGDYTNYTEEDVAAGAKILTGWLVDGLVSDTLPDVTAGFQSILHDTSTKTLSAHFGSAVIPDNGANEYSDYIDIIFQQDEVARFICRKLYRFFVNYDLTTDVENLVITELANTMIANNYEVLPVLQELLTSEHFYDISVRGAMIRGPLDALFSMLNATGSQPNYDLATDSEMRVNLYGFAEILSQAYAVPPNVAGWPAYYQEPAYSKLWINSTHLKNRFDFSSWLTIYTGIPVNSNFFKVNALNFVDNLSQPSDPVVVIDDMADVFCPKGLNVAQKLTLKTILTGGQPDSEWTIQYSQYIADPGNATVSDPIRTKVELVLSYLYQMPEFHVM